MLRRSFSALVATQFLTVVNDSMFKQCVLLVAIAVQGATGSAQALGGALFSLPFLLFASFAGDCADRFPKRRVILAAKAAEVAVMLLAALAFASGSLAFLFVVVFLMGAQSSFLGPAKYGALPEHAPPARLGYANGIFQAFVLGGILLGTGFAGDLKEALAGRLWLYGLVLAALAAVGWAIALGIHPQPAADPTRELRYRPVARFRQGLRAAAAIPHLLPVIFGHATFWLAGALLQLGWNEFLGARADGSPGLDIGEGAWSRMLALLSVAMAGGGLTAGRLAGGKVRRGMVTLGACGMALGFLGVALVPRAPLPLFTAAAVAAFFSGFYVIPLRTLVQHLPPRARVGAAIGISQLCDFLFIFSGSLARAPLRMLGLETQPLFALLAAVMLAAGFAMRRHLPRVVAVAEPGPA